MMKIGRVSGGTGKYIPWAASPCTARRGREPPSHECLQVRWGKSYRERVMEERWKKRLEEAGIRCLYAFLQK
ncbi:hypothetical protein IG631_05924 [Alternaria alternata]|nr:hypothetical protein IG631_05924 [Alternaria alternata]